MTSIKAIRTLSAFVAMLLPISLACSLFTPTVPAPPPTEEPAVQATTEQPTEAQQPPDSSAPFELDSALYTHPSGAFSFYPPAGWAVEEGENGDALFTSPDDMGAIYITVSNTGHTLDSEAFVNFAMAVEQNFFGERDQYKALESQVDPGQELMFRKSFLFDDVPQEVTSHYYQESQAVYTVDFWAAQSVSRIYQEAYEQIEVEFDPLNVASLPLYNFIYTFYGPNDLFTIEVPTAWMYETQIDGNIIVDSFHAPDGHALIENIMYDDGSYYSAGDAGKAALRILNQFYTKGAGDIKVSEDSIQKDGSERLTWTSQQGGYSGVTFFEVRNETSLLIFSVLYDNPYEDTYLPVLDYTIESYTRQ